MFIAFEGLDGSGSSTQSRLLAEKLETNGHAVLLTKEPTGDTQTGKMIRDILQHKWKCGSESLQLLFSADRAEHLKNKIEPAIQNGQIVITDRYFFSTIAYGSLAVDDWGWLKCLSKKFRLPDITFLFKLAPEICIQRIQGRGSDFELFEENEKLGKIWKGYEKLTNEYDNIQIVDATQKIEDIEKYIWSVVKSRI